MSKNDYLVYVKATYRWPTARVAGMQFSKAGAVRFSAGTLPDAVRDSPLLRVCEMPTSPESVDATVAAVELAEENGIDLAKVAGSGEGGRVLVGDVREVIDG